VPIPQYGASEAPIPQYGASDVPIPQYGASSVDIAGCPPAGTPGGTLAPNPVDDAPVMTAADAHAILAPALAPLAPSVPQLAPTTPSPLQPDSPPSTSTSTSAAATATALRSPSWPCRSCHAQVPLADDVCAHCGSAFLPSDAAVSLVLPGVGDVARMEKGGRAMLMVVGALVLTGVFFVLALVLGSFL
jgi:hypothetical protein